ncbi:MAG: FecR family protein [Tsuneonella suprasediminis]
MREARECVRGTPARGKNVEMGMNGQTEADRMQGDLSRQATAWLVRLDDAPDDETLRMEFMDWLATSPAHIAAWEETARVSRLLSATAPLRRNVSVRPAETARWRKIPPVKALVSLGLAACLAWLVVPDLVVQLRSDVITGTGELRLVTLTDGSTVHLAPTSAIAFSNGESGRTLNLLRGEAWFDIAPDKARPFRVMAGDSTVTVLGTAFSVRMMEDGTDVAVQRGRVAVTTPEGAPAGRIELVAGQSLSVREDGETERGQIRVDQVASWRERVAIVNDQPIGDVIDRIRPWYGGYIIARGPGLKHRRVSGIYDLRDPDRALEALTRVDKVTVSKVSRWLRIVTIG